MRATRTAHSSGMMRKMRIQSCHAVALTGAIIGLLLGDIDRFTANTT